MTARKFGWHFAGSTLRDGSPLPEVGEWEQFDGELEMCKSGLHVGITPWDALQYAPGETLRLIEYKDVGEQQSDKVVCRRRRTIAQMDATELLRYFARLQAISCIERWKSNPPDEVLDWLGGGENQSAAESAARSAARSAAWSAAESAAWSAAESAAWSAAESAAESAAWSAAESAARSAAESAAWSAAESAAWSAAESAAWSAARSAAASEFNTLVYECFEGPMTEVGFKP